jgi:hypothetical protein
MLLTKTVSTYKTQEIFTEGETSVQLISLCQQVHTSCFYTFL